MRNANIITSIITWLEAIESNHNTYNTIIVIISIFDERINIKIRYDGTKCFPKARDGTWYQWLGYYKVIIK